MKYLIVLMVFLVGCHSTDETKLKPTAAANGPDPTGTGFNWGVSGTNQLSNFSCLDAQAPIQGWDAGYPVCFPTTTGIPSGIGLVAVGDGGAYVLTCDGGSLVTFDGSVPICEPLATIPQGGTNNATAPSEGQILFSTSSTQYAPETIQPDIYCSTTTPGLCYVVQATGDGGTNAYQSSGTFPILAQETVQGFGHTTNSVSVDVGSILTIDGGTNILVNHLIGSGTVRLARISIAGRNNCIGSVDSQTCQFLVMIAEQSDGGGSVMTPTSPTCAAGAPTFIAGGSAYGTPTVVLDGGYLSVYIQGVADAGCIDGGIDWGAEVNSVIVQ
jgi:hypothetical protein